MGLRSERFYYEENLIAFVNQRKISKEDIQQIIFVDNVFVIFYWAPFKR